LTRAFEISGLINQMGHFLAGFLTALLTGSGWDKPDLSHFGCPLFIVVGLSWPFTEVVLPEMYHFMGKG
jgi:hypothetical protein